MSHAPNGLRALGLGAALLVAACSSPPSGPLAAGVPPFVFVAGVNGKAQLFRWTADSVHRLVADSANDSDPRMAAGRLAYTSDRTGVPHIYLADADTAPARRATAGNAVEGWPALSPGADSIAYVANGGGVLRIWLVAAPPAGDTTVATAAPLATGSSAAYSEGAPAWNPRGGSIAFTSTRGGISQVYVVPSGGGSAVQLTHEAGGAFAPAWTADGSTVLYVSGSGLPALRAVNVATGGASSAAADTLGIGEPSCGASLCLAVTDPSGSGGAIVVFTPGHGSPVVVLPRTSGEREPAFVSP